MPSDFNSSSSVSSQSSGLLRAIEAGDREAFRRLFQRYSPGLKKAIAARMDPRLSQRVDPSDILQETEMAVFLRIDDYLKRRPMPLEKWLWQTAQQCVISAWRMHVQAERRSVNREDQIVDHSSWQLFAKLSKRSVDRQRESEQQCASQKLDSILKRIPDSDREILVLRGLKGLTSEQAAVRLNISLAAAKKRFTRAVLRARDLMNQLDQEDEST